MSANVLFMMFMILMALVFALAIGIAIGIGANDETLATVAGTGKLKMNHVLIIGVICSIAGALIFGSGTSETIGTGLLHEELIAAPFILAIITSTILWLILASMRSLPVSTTHSVVGSAIGIAILSFFLPFVTFGGLPPIKPEGIIKVLIGWGTSPLVGLLVTYGVQLLLSRVLLKNVKGMERIEKVQKYFMWALLGIVIWTALTRAGNDVANSVGIVFGFFNLPAGSLAYYQMLYFLLLISGIGMALGLFVIGRKVIKNVGSNIVQMKPSDAFAVQISVMLSLTIFTLPFIGMPISGTQVLIFAIIGASYAKKEKVNKKAIWKIVLSWAITIPVAAIAAIGFFFMYMGLGFWIFIPP